MSKTLTYPQIKKLITDKKIKSFHKRLINWILKDIDILPDGDGSMSKTILLHEGFKGDTDNNIELELTISSKYLITEKSKEQKKDFKKEKMKDYRRRLGE